jgi:hypothetical protein
LVELDVESDLRLQEGAIAFADDADEQDPQHQHREGDRAQPVEAESALGRVAAAQARLRQIGAADRDGGERDAVSHIFLCSGARW